MILKLYFRNLPRNVFKLPVKIFAAITLGTGALSEKYEYSVDDRLFKLAWRGDFVSG